jgi:hypothetical protein
MNSRALALRHRLVPVDQIRERGGILTVFSGQERKGDWEVPRNFRVACVCGNTELDFREARIAEGVTVIEVFCMFGNVEMTFPPGVRIDTAGDALAGSFVVHTDPTIVPDDDAPTIRIVGTAYFGNVEAHVRYPGERERDARKRIRSA